MIAQLPERISYSTLNVDLDDGTSISIPRRELWDVRVQLMAEAEIGNGKEEEEEDGVAAGLGKSDVKTGVYEGGFKSWECSVDLVRLLAARRNTSLGRERRRVVELGCGTALPSLALLQWHLASQSPDRNLDLSLADYNPTVLQLVTLPNVLLSWAQTQDPSFPPEGDLELTPELLQTFSMSLENSGLRLHFFSGGWSQAFVSLVTSPPSQQSPNNLPSGSPPAASSNPEELLVLAAETIYSPAALNSFTEALLGIFDAESRRGIEGRALVGAKKVYFGVGGSIEDFANLVRRAGKEVDYVREEEAGVRRAVVEITSK